jgi:HSP20 family protein
MKRGATTMKNENMTLRQPTAVDSSGDLPRNVVAPYADIYETPEAYVLRLDLPGARKEAVTLTMEKNVLEVSATVEPHHDKSFTVLHRELRITGYHRVFSLGEGIDRDSVDALFEDGVLTVKLFKTSETKPRTITIN